MISVNITNSNEQIELTPEEASHWNLKSGEMTNGMASVTVFMSHFLNDLAFEFYLILQVFDLSPLLVNHRMHGIPFRLIDCALNSKRARDTQGYRLPSWNAPAPISGWLHRLVVEVLA